MKNIQVKIPSSKSYTNRALIIAALCREKVELRNVLYSEDTLLMIEALKKLGIEIEIKRDRVFVNNSIHNLSLNGQEIYMGYSGTVYRFFLSMLSLLKGKVTLTGEPELMRRPIKELLESLEKLGLTAVKKRGKLKITSKCKKTGRIIYINPRKSSQFLSALLMTAPLVKGGVIIKCTDEIVSYPYIELTIDIMKNFGVNVINPLKMGNKSVTLAINSKFSSLNDRNMNSAADSFVNKKFNEFIVEEQPYSIDDFYYIEGDYSSASYFLAAPLVTGCTLRIKGLKKNSCQGDRKFLNVLKKMGARIKFKKNDIIIQGKTKFKGIKKIDMSRMQDIVPTLAVLAVFAETPTKIVNIENLRYKETDRIEAVYNELKRMGVEVEKTIDSIKIYPCRDLKPAKIKTYNDHRIAMSFSLATLKNKDIQIMNQECTSKTFPDFFDLWKKVSSCSR